VQLLLLQLLGAGGFCSVWLCKPLGLDAWRAALGLAPDAALPRQLAVKVPVTSRQARQGVTPHDCADWCLGGRSDGERERNGHREAAFLEMLGAVPYVADLLLVGRSVLLVPPTPGADLEQVDLPVMVMEAALLGTLQDALHNRGPLSYLDVPLFPWGMMPEQLAKYYALQVLAALVAQWASGCVIHRDLKGGNILNTIYKGQPIGKIADLGLAAQVTGAGGTVVNRTQAGTRDHASPEQILGQPQSHPADIWAVGILLLELVHCQSPLAGKQQWARPEVASADPAAVAYLEAWLNEGGHGLSWELRSFCAWLCAADPARRPNAFQAMCHSFMTD
jgi:serine/threonine protein kinase